MRILIVLVLSLFAASTAMAQPSEDKLGAWYMYFWNKDFKQSQFGIQGDFQHRSWNILGDQEQLLLRSGLTYRPKNTNIKLTAGYAYINTGAYGEGKSVSQENRIYQEMLIPNLVGQRFYFTHRFRYEQRFIVDNDFRTRWRYNIFLNIPLNDTKLVDGVFYLAFYNELFINKRNNNVGSEVFDRNRTYGGLGYTFKPNLRAQLGAMRQATNTWAKNQLQVSLHHSF